MSGKSGRFIGITSTLIVLCVSGIIFQSQKDAVIGPIKGKFMLHQKSSAELTHFKDLKARVGSEPILLLIVAYHRTGSTFTASLFQTYPGSFYIFEPLNAVYIHNWLTYMNGSSVFVDKNNYASLAEDEFHHAMTCNIEHVSLNLIFHHARFAFNDSLIPLQRCLYDQIRKYTLRQQLKDISLNSRQLNSMSNRTYKVYYNLEKYQNKTTGFEMYFNPQKCGMQGLCISTVDLQQMSQTCLKISNVIKHCKTAPLKVFKFIRISMSNANTLLDEFPSMKIIYLLRDPRAATLSMNAREPQRNISTLSTEYCDFIKGNRNVCDRLNQIHPNSLYRIQYERLALDPINMTKQMYKFVGLQFLESVEKYIRSVALSAQMKNCAYCVDRGDSRKTAEGWRLRISEAKFNEINRICADEIKEMGLRLLAFEQVKNMSHPLL